MGISKKPISEKAGQVPAKPRIHTVFAAANAYGLRSFENYALIRSVAEQVRTSLCDYLDHEHKCVFLVPPSGPFKAQDYGSGAFSVSGKGFLPLEPISFGLGIKISADGDFLRIVLSCRKEGGKIIVQIEHDKSFDLPLPKDGESLELRALEALREGLYQYILHWFTDRIDQYDNGSYGTSDIGFDLLRIEADD